ncbi:MAG: phage portal protein [Ruminococcaceae bacterium]|nr:phage portal protein [Oscillospiraceae bacterium]
MSIADIITTELSGLYGQKVLEDMGDIIRLYDFYEGRGQDWQTAQGLDYRPAKVVTNLCKKLIKREARFMFGRTPELRVLDSDNMIIEEYQQMLDGILEDNAFPERLIKGLRDCLIGKRVAIKLTGGVGQPIGVQIRPSLEFVYETFDDDADRLRKIIFFYRMNDSASLEEQRIWRQKYELSGDRCFITEGVYDGRGKLVEGGECINSGLPFIPCRVVLNDGLTGDLSGESDVAEIMEGQNAYNRLKSDDMDALRFNMFPQRVAVDADGESLEQMTIAPGSLVDLMTDPACGDDGRQAKLTMLEASFNYDQRFENAINRVKQDMHELLGVPNLSLEQLRGLAQSGKAMRALYWELQERCEERWTVWEPALQWMCRTIFAMLTIYGDTRYDAPCKIHVEHLYPIPEDEEAERELDLREVAAGVRSPESYREKWNI